MDKPRSSTDWLNGLRGFAALIVVFHHFGLAFWHQTAYAYGTQLPVGWILDRQPYLPYAVPVQTNRLQITSDAQDNHSILQLPFVRLFYAGDPMVAIFFIVSGYSLSVKPLSLMRKRCDTRAQLMSSLSSAAFRRPIRLLLPCIVSTLIIALVAATGLYNHAAMYAGGSYEHMREFFHGWVLEPPPPIQSSLIAQLSHWFHSLSNFLDFFTHKHFPWSVYDRHTWTIPAEFRCSYFLFVTQAATSAFAPNVRLAVLALLVTGAFTWGYDTWDIALFWSGMALCELNMMHDASPSRTSRLSAWSVGSLKGMLLFIGGYLASTPTFQHEYSPMYAFLDAVRIPGLDSFQERFWVAIGSLLIVLVFSFTQSIKGFFSSPVATYLGRISFSLYLVHGPVLRGLGYSLAVVMLKLVGNDAPWKYNLAGTITLIICMPVIFVLSHLFCIAVDEPIVRLARWTENRLKGIGQAESGGLPSYRPLNQFINTSPAACGGEMDEENDEGKLECLDSPLAGRCHSPMQGRNASISSSREHDRLVHLPPRTLEEGRGD